MFKPINYGYNDSKGSKDQQSDLIINDIIVGKSLLNTQCQYKLNDDKPILEFIKNFREDKTNLIANKFIYQQNNDEQYSDY
jgi:hypothetical protein